MFDNLPIRHKLLVLLGLSLGAGLLVSALVALYTTFAAERQSSLRELHQVAAIISENMRAALAFHDAQSTAKILQPLHTNPHIQYAAVQDDSGRLLGEYWAPAVNRSEATRWLATLRERHAANEGVLQRMKRGHHYVIHPIDFEGKQIGNLTLLADNEAMYDKMRQYVVLQMGATVLIFFSLLLLSWRLQLIFTRPILELIASMQRIANSKDYTTVLATHGTDEFSELYRGFNTILQEIRIRASVADHVFGPGDGRTLERSNAARHHQPGRTGKHHCSGCHAAVDREGRPHPLPRQTGRTQPHRNRRRRLRWGASPAGSLFPPRRQRPEPAGIYPDGFLPRIEPRITDLSVTLGAKGILADASHWSVAYTGGMNDFHFYVNHSLNRSLGSDSPTSFDSGRTSLAEHTLNADISHDFGPHTLAAGYGYRRSRYRIRAGELASYQLGPDSAWYPGAQGFAGFSPDNAVSAERESHALYVDSKHTLLPRLMLTAAARAEHYSDFDSTVNGKLALRWQPTAQITASVDGLITDIDDRIMVTGYIAGWNLGQLNPQALAILQQHRVDGATYFTNAIGTRTRGFDLRLEHRWDLRQGRHLQLRAAYGYAATRIRDVNRAPSVLGVDMTELVLDPFTRTTMEAGQPDSAFKLWTRYSAPAMS